MLGKRKLSLFFQYLVLNGQATMGGGRTGISIAAYCGASLDADVYFAVITKLGDSQ